MKLLVVLCFVALVAAQGTYRTTYDSFDIQTVVNDPDTLESYGRCLLGQGPCTPMGEDFKNKIPEALQNSCRRCTPNQRFMIRTLVPALKTQFPNLWEQLRQQQNPNGQYTKQFNDFLSGTD